jgi:4-hydroxy-3-polyprenylbenzoate decarboxylase
LRGTLGSRGVKSVSLHEPLTGRSRVTLITVEKGTPRTEVWRALNGAAFFKGDCGKICIAVNDDIDPDNVTVPECLDCRIVDAHQSDERFAC